MKIIILKVFCYLATSIFIILILNYPIIAVFNNTGDLFFTNREIFMIVLGIAANIIVSAYLSFTFINWIFDEL